MNDVEQNDAAAEAEVKFQKENGMTLMAAWGHVKQWQLQGKKEEAIKGCEEIIKYFPEHEAKDLLVKMQDPNYQSATQSEANPEKKQDMVEKAGEKIGSTVIEKLQEVKEGIGKSIDTEAGSPSEGADEQSGELTKHERMYAALSYAWILVFVPLVFNKEGSKFMKFHAKQGLVLFLILFFFDSWIIGVLSIFLGKMFSFAFSSMMFLMLAIPAFGAYRGKWTQIPLIYKLSQKVPL